MNKKCKFRKRAMLLLAAFFVTEAKAQTCIQPPSCDSLGYIMSETECIGLFLRCPLDASKVFCQQEKCVVGSILYNDKSCSASVQSGKTPVGIVFDLSLIHI